MWASRYPRWGRRSGSSLHRPKSHALLKTKGHAVTNINRKQPTGKATMTRMPITKRNFLTGTAAAAFGGLVPQVGHAAGTFAATVYPGPWEEAYRQFVVPRAKQQHNIDVQLYPLLSADQIAKQRASRNEAAFDVFTLDPAPR